MSRRGTALMVTVAVASGLVAAVGIYRHLATRPVPRAGATQAEIAVVVTRSTLARGTILTAEHLVVTMVAREAVPAVGAFAQPRSLIGRLVKEEISAGAPVLEASLAPSEHRPIRTTAVGPGYRAVGVSIDPRGGIHEFLQVGDRVDVVVTMDDELGIPAAKVVLQDIEVLAVAEKGASLDRRRALGPGGVPVTLAVTPQDAEILSLAMHIGTIQLLVRGYADNQIAQTSGVTRDTLLPGSSISKLPAGEGERAAMAPEASSITYRSVELIKGQERYQRRFRMMSGDLGLGGAVEVPSEAADVGAE